MQTTFVLTNTVTKQTQQFESYAAADAAKLALAREAGNSHWLVITRAANDNNVHPLFAQILASHGLK